MCSAGLLPLMAGESNSGDILTIKGEIASYKIEMEITSAVTDSSTFTGRYKYLSQKNYLSVTGQNFGNVLYIEEFWDGKQTGAFYLDREGDTLTGWWVNETKVLPVILTITGGNYDLLKFKTLEEYSDGVSSEITGTYKVDYYFINDYFASEDNPVYETGYNGGCIIFTGAGKDSLNFSLEFICGPTYHFAIAEGVAVKQGDYYVYSEDPYDYGENCKIVFKFGEKSVSAVAEENAGCGFGARAYVDHELIKVRD